MLFNSYEFIFLFLPLSLLGFFVLGHRGRTLSAVAWLGLASLAFYAWWNPRYLALLLASILFNYYVGRRLSSSQKNAPHDRLVLFLGVACNLALLAYFKYVGFFLSNVNSAFGTAWSIGNVILPLGISFFTFTQIAYLVDAFRKEVREYRFFHYLLFVTFFPHLIAGPVLHHAEIMPQFHRPRTFRLQTENFSVGLTIFLIGLFKKVVLADGIAEYATPVFAAAHGGASITGLAAWGAALSYTFQLYFDFSGYSDMAIGLARLFGIVFPANFNSPYKATSIIEFWRRWHMTLSRFLRDYLYIPLGGSRCGPLRRHLNLFLTMLLGGLWHGAGWTFIIWGALHGSFLIINHGWRHVRLRFLPDRVFPVVLGRFLARLLTFLCVVVAWVFFRAESLDAALGIFKGMLGFNGFSKKDPYYFGAPELKWIVALWVIAWALPNLQQVMHRYKAALETYSGEITPPGRSWLGWKPAWPWAMLTAALGITAMINMSRISEFLYFQF